MKYNQDWLLEQHVREEKVKYLFFWGHQPRKDGSIGESCFSQWWLVPFTVEGIVYQTAEHWMMAAKACLFSGQTRLEQILQCISPAEAKKIGRMVSNFDGKRWDEHKYDLVKEGNYHKFSQHPDIKAFLLNTKGRVLGEASPVDQIWGIGLAKTDPHIENPANWKGENLLGFALMEVRDELEG